MKKDLLVTLADKNFIKQAKQLFSSVYWNAGWKGDYMLLAHEIPEKDLKWFKDKGILIKRCKALYHGKVGGMSATLTSKFYLFTPEFKKWDTIIYLDADIIVRASLDKLTKIKGFGATLDVWDTKIEGQIINNRFIEEKRKINKKIFKKILKELQKEYSLRENVFCAGVLAFRSDIIKKDILPKLNNTLKKYRKISMYGDQLAFNLVFYKKWKKLPLLYNIFPRYMEYHCKLDSNKIKGIIIHYAGVSPGEFKAWDFKSYFYREWKKNLEKADLIDLEKIQSPAKKWGKLEITLFSSYLRFRIKMRGTLKWLNNKARGLIKKFYPVYVFAFPDKICIDASTICNLKCVQCYTGQRKQGMSKGFLKFKDFKKFIDKYHIYLKQLLLSNWGEIFLNPEIFKIIKYAKQKGIFLTADSNLNYLNQKMAEELVKTQMDELVVSLDGATNKIYLKYRVGGDLNKVISNIKLINKYKKKYNSEYPKLIWQFILFNHNKHEINKAKQTAKELNMNFKLKEDGACTNSNVTKLDKYKIKEKIYNPPNFCYQLWDSPIINYNGNLLGCCIIYNEKHNFGNVFEEGFFSAFNSKKIREARKVILKKGIYPNCECSYCTFRKNVGNHKFLKLKFRFQGLILSIDRTIGKIGILLKKLNPKLYYIIKKIIK